MNTGTQATQQEARVSIVETKGPDQTRCEIIGGWKEIDSVIEEHKREYHPHGYGTEVKARHGQNDGQTWVLIMRLSSCH